MCIAIVGGQRCDVISFEINLSNHGDFLIRPKKSKYFEIEKTFQNEIKTFFIIFKVLPLK